ncbi:MAG: sulfotransferase [Myxococcota bacterium]
MDRPFIYIAALRRSGSNLLCEALSQLPRSFVFREPGIPRGLFRLKDDDVARFAELGVDLRALRRARPEAAEERLADFAGRVLPALRERVEQLGIKEIKHAGWRELLAALPDTRIVVTARDPRDVYVSLHHKRADRGIAFKGELTPAGVAEEVERTFREQRAMLEETDALRIRYEDLCTDPGTWETLRDHVDSPLADLGSVGDLNRHNRRVHGDTVSALHVGRWRHEPDAGLRAGAEATFERLSGYAAFWGYA